jgi:hypothetical protein
VPREASVGTNASHDEGVLWKRDAVAEGGAGAGTALRRSGSVQCRCKTAHRPPIQLRRAGCQPSFRVGLCGRGISVRIRIGICPVFGSGAQTRCASKATFFPRLCNAESSQHFCKSGGRAADYETFRVSQTVDKTGSGTPSRAPGDSVPAEVEQVFEEVAALAAPSTYLTAVVERDHSFDTTAPPSQRQRQLRFNPSNQLPGSPVVQSSYLRDGFTAETR